MWSGFIELVVNIGLQACRARQVMHLWHVVRYESLMADIAQQTRAICGFLGLEWVAGMDDFASRARAREHATPSTAQLARGLDRSGLAHWRHYRAPLEPILPTLRRWVEHLGYPA
jgi:hypothetical protein